MGWQRRQDLESDVLIHFNALPVPWFQTQKTHKNTNQDSRQANPDEI